MTAKGVGGDQGDGDFVLLQSYSGMGPKFRNVKKPLKEGYARYSSSHYFVF